MNARFVGSVLVLGAASAASAAVVEVQVGTYYLEPQFPHVEVGDTIRWIWDGGNHDVTSGAFCGDDTGLFYAPITSGSPTFEWTIPAGYGGQVIPYYCSVGNHCVAGNQYGGLLVDVGTAHFVSSNGFAFEPSDITVDAGDVVIWIHDGGSHTVTSGSNCVADGRFDELFDNLHQMPLYVVPEDEPTGTIEYYCAPHCSFGMTGTIGVTGVAPTGACCELNVLCWEDMTEVDCLSLGDSWYEGMSCAEADCLALGACCIPDGSGGTVCEYMVQESCAGQGEWLGWDIVCEDVSCTCDGDIDGDGTVGVNDLLALLAKYGDTCTGCPEDIDGDGTIGVNDLLGLLDIYGTNC